jgi:hypothetical protein
VVAFEADDFLSNDEGWSVVVPGIAGSFTHADQLLRVRTLPHSAVTDDRVDQFVAMPQRTITRRLVQFTSVGPSALAEPGCKP